MVMTTNNRRPARRQQNAPLITRKELKAVGRFVWNYILGPLAFAFLIWLFICGYILVGGISGAIGR